MNCLMTKKPTNSVQYFEVKTIMVTINTISWLISKKEKKTAAEFCKVFFVKLVLKSQCLYLVLPLMTLGKPLHF